jgi:hypothetical protein
LSVPSLSRAFLTFASVLVLAAAAPGCAKTDAREPFRLVGMDEVEQMLSDPGVAIIDANTRETFEKNHLPGAKYYKSAPLAQLLPADKSTRLVFYCASPS